MHARLIRSGVERIGITGLSLTRAMWPGSSHFFIRSISRIKPKCPKSIRKRPLVEPLEPRVLFSADFIPSTQGDLNLADVYETDPNVSLIALQHGSNVSDVVSNAEPGTPDVQRDYAAARDQSTLGDRIHFRNEAESNLRDSNSATSQIYSAKDDSYPAAPITVNSSADAISQATTDENALSAQPLYLIIKDASVSNERAFIDELKRSQPDAVEWIEIAIDSDDDGVNELTDLLDGVTEISGIHIVSSGTESFALGRQSIDADSLALYHNEIKKWGDTLVDDARVTLHGCDLGSCVLIDTLNDHTEMVFTSASEARHIAADPEPLDLADLPDTDPLEPATELIFVDYRTPDAQALIDDVKGKGADEVNYKIVFLNADDNGIDVITNTLEQFDTIAAVHIISHGSDGSVQLGAQVLNKEALQEYSNAIGSWQKYLADDADLLIYGCDVAATVDGQSFIDELAYVTGADVAASNDATGNEELGGDWEFEYTVGSIEAELALSFDMQASYAAALATVTVDNMVDAVNGDTSSIANLVADDGGDGISLREAILAANATYNIADTIFLGSGVHMLSLSGSGNSLGDLDINTDIQILGAADGSTIIDASMLNDRVFHIQNQDTVFRNLTIQGGVTFETAGGGGVLVAGGAATAEFHNVVISGNAADIGGGVRSSGKLTVIDSTFDGNISTDEGGGVALSDGNNRFENVTFTDNTAGSYGGAIFVSNGINEFTNVTISGNTAATAGGGIAVTSGTATIDNATITDNVAASGGGLSRTSGNVNVTGSIIADNDGTSNVEVAGTINSGGNNIIGDNPGDSAGGNGYVADDLLDQTGLSLGPLADNGGQVQTHELLNGSVGVDGAGAATAGETDGRGYYLIDPLRDIGAFERNAVPPLEAALVAHFEFEQGSGTTAVDSSVTNNDGSIVGAAAWTSSSAVGSQAIDLSGDTSANNTFVNVPDNSAYDFGTGDFSISLWYNMVTPTETVHLVGNTDGNATNTGFRIAASAGGQVMFQRSSGTVFGTVGVAAPFDGQWHQLIVSLDAGVVKIFIDGVEQVAAVVDTASNVNSSWPLTIGAVDAVDDDFEGKLDDVRIYARALTDTEVVMLAAASGGDSSGSNTAPTFSGTLDGIASYTEGFIAGAVMDADVTIFDTELSAIDDFGGTTLQLQRVGGANPDDNFNRSGALFFTGSTFTLSGVQKGSYSATPGQLTLTFDTGVSNDDVNSVMQLLAYRTFVDNPPASVDIEWTFNDGNPGSQGSGGALDIVGTTTVNITGVNDKATVDLDVGDQSGATDGGFNTVFDGTPVLIAGSDAILIDPDSTTMHRMDVEVTNVLDGASEFLSVDTSAYANINTLAYNPATGSLIIYGTGTAAEYQAILRSVVYHNSEVTPDPTTRVISVKVTDGSGFGDKSYTNVTMASGPTDLSSGIELNTDGGNDAYLIANDGGAIFGGATALTVETNFAGIPSVTKTPLIAYAAGAAGGNDLYVNIEPGGDLSFYIDGVGQVSSALDYTTLLNGEKHSLALSWDNALGSWAVYVDGQLLDSGTGFAATRVLAGSAGTGELVFGHDQDSVGGGFDPDRAFQGTFYDVRIWNTVRSDIEIAAIYEQKLDPASLPGDLIANWQFDGFDGANEIVDVVSANNLSVGHATGNGFVVGTPINDLNVDENSTDNTSVGFVVASGVDYSTSGVHGGFTFSLSEDANGRFAIDSDTGEIIVSDGSQLNHQANSAHTVTVEVSDALGNTYDEDITIAVNDINLAPVFSNLDDNPTFIEGLDPVTLDADVTIFDADLSAIDIFTNAQLIVGPANDGHRIGINGSPVSLFSPIIVQGINIGSVGVLTLDSSDIAFQPFHFNSNANNALVNAFMQSLTYEFTDANPPASVDISWTFNDGNSGGQGAGGALEVTATSTVNVAANNVPVIDVNGAAAGTDVSLTFSENDAAIFLARDSIVDEFGEDDIVSLTLTASGFGSTNSSDTLQIVGLTLNPGVPYSNSVSFYGGVIVDFTYDGNEKVTFTNRTGATDPIPPLYLQSLVSILAYRNTSDSLVTDNIDFQFTLEDSIGQQSAIATSTVSVAAVNDAPEFLNVNQTVTPFINEIHYDNNGLDEGERIEIAGAAGTDLTGWSVVRYNGSNGLVYGTDALVGTIADQGQGVGTAVVNFPANGLQNGDRDGIALVDDTGAVLQLLSWEGNFTAVDGPAAGMTSIDIGVVEDSHSPRDTSIQLTDAGWVAEIAETFGTQNTGQNFSRLFDNYPSQSVAEGGQLVFSDASGNAITIGDIDALGAELAVTLEVSNGMLSLGSTNGLNGLAGNGSSAVVFTGTLADINSALDGLTYNAGGDYFGFDQLTLTVDDQGNTGAPGNLTDVATVQIDVTPVNDAPTLSNIEAIPVGYTENSAPVGITGNLTLADVDDTVIESGTVSISGNYVAGEDVLSFTNLSGIAGGWNAATGELTLTGSATLAQYESALQTVAYHNTSDNPDTTTRTVSFSINDGELNSNTLSRDITIEAVNDTPLIDLNGGASAGTGLSQTFIENDPALRISPLGAVDGFGEDDIVSLTIEAAGFGATGSAESLDLSGQLVQAGTPLTDSLILFSGATAVFVYNGSEIITVSSVAGETLSTDDLLHFIRSISYQNPSDKPIAGDIDFGFTLQDSGGLQSAIAISTAAVVPVNDAPVLSTIEALPVYYTENNPPLGITGNLTLADVDDDNIETATVTISGNFAPGEDELVFTNQPGIAGSYDAGTGAMTLTGNASVADYQTAMRAVAYNNTSDNPSTLTRTVSFEIDDGEVPGNTLSREIEFNAVNDAPVISAIETTPVQYTENDPAVLLTSNLSLADIDDINLDSASVTISANLSIDEDLLVFTDQAGISGLYDNNTGTLTLTGSASVMDYQTALRSITYHNTSDAPSDLTRTVSFEISDGDDNSNILIRDIDLAAVNDAPVLSGIEVLPASYSENGSPVIITASLSVTDVDDLLIDSAAVSISDNFAPGEDILAFTDQPGITGTYNVASGVLTLSGSSSAASYQAALRTVTYENISDNPSDLTRTISFAVSDGEVFSNPGTRALQVIAVDDAPVLSAMETVPAAFTEKGAPITITGNLSVSDVDDILVDGATVSIAGDFNPSEDSLLLPDTSGIEGSYDYESGVLTLTGTASAADYQTALQSVTYHNNSDNPDIADRSIDFVVTVGELFSNTLTRTIEITPVNDPPQLSWLETSPLVINESGVVTDLTSTIGLHDADDTVIQSATIAITTNFSAGNDLLTFTDQAGITGSFDSAAGVLTLSGSSSLQNYEAALRTVGFVNTSNDQASGTRTVEFSVRDNADNSNMLLRQLIVVDSNDPPVIANTEVSPLRYLEGSGAVSVTQTLSLADLDNNTLQSARVMISANFTAGQDFLEFTEQSGITATYNAMTGILQLSGTAGIADYQTALRSVSYANYSDNPSVLLRTVDFLVDDGDAVSNIASRDIVLTSSNDNPVLIDIESDPLTYTENQLPINVTSSLIVNDADDNLLENASVAITGNFIAGQDMLSFESAANISGSFDANTGVLSLSGTGTLAQYQSVLRSVTYQNHSDNPSAQPRTVEFSVGDPLSNSNIVSRTIVVQSVNDAPSGTDNSISFLEDTDYVLATADFGFTDVLDNHSFAGVIIQKLPSLGTLSLNGAVVDNGKFIAIDDISTGNLLFTPQADASGSAYDKLEFHVVDDGGTSLNGIDTSVTINDITFNVVNINDQPRGTDNFISIREDTSYIFTSDDFGYSDPLDNDQFQAVTIVTLPDSGLLALDGETVDSGTIVNVALIDAGLLTFTPAPDANGPGHNGFAFQVHDDGGINNGGLAIDQIENRISFDLAGVNDAPLLINNGATVDEGSDNTLTTEVLFATDADDPSPQELTFTINSLPINGTLLLNGSAASVGATFTLEQLQLDQLRYAHDGSETTTDFFDIQVSDGGEDGTMPAVGRFELSINEVIDAAPDIDNETVTLEFGQLFDSQSGSQLESGVNSLAIESISYNPRLIVSIETPPSRGVLDINSDGTFSYQHDGSAVLQDSFRYRVTNEDGIFAIATVEINIEPPVASAFDRPADFVSAFETIQTEQRQKDDQEQETEVVEASAPAESEGMTQPGQPDFDPAPDSAFVFSESGDTDLIVEEVTTLDELIAGPLNQRLADTFLDELEVRQHNTIQLDVLGNTDVAVNTVGFNILAEVNTVDLHDVVTNKRFVDGLQQLDQDLQDSEESSNRRYQLANDTAIGVSLSATAGVLAWALRGGVLFASAMASTPLWSSIDPLRVIAANQRDESSDKEDEVEQYFNDK